MPTEASAPYFTLSVRGRWTDSARTPQHRHHFSPGAEFRSKALAEEWIAVTPCVPYFELAVVGTVRVW
jgi:hypothetical protein